MPAIRTRPFFAAPLVLALALAAPALGLAAGAKPAAVQPADAFAEKTKSARRRDGLLVTWLDAKAGRLLLELPRPSGARNECGRFLYLEAIRTGLGSNPVGLDRGQLGEARVVAFRRVGGRILLEQPNLRYRAQSQDSSEVRAVRESFASSVLWGAEIAAEAPDGRLLVDLTSFVVRDAHGAIARLRAAGQGAFGLDKDRSVLDPDNCPAFPENIEFEALLTLAGDEPAREVRETAPTPQAITLVQHQSLVRLPDDRYLPRAWDPRSGSFDVLFADYARPIAADLEVRWLVRHRLEKVEPSAARSRVKRPIVYYVDRGAPEPIRSALMEGAAWWAQAFDAAGFIDAFQVQLLPPDADPLDLRYNVIQWVHRATRGWSYGGGIIDPRTGEMVKGHVTLGSLRIRQDRMIFEGLAGTERTGTGAPDDPVELSLARIRQLAAHEVGHTLGFNHNFAASTYGRASVMDYPAPMVGVRSDGTLDFSRAYATGIGVWDIQQVRYAYTQFPPDTDERAALEAILRENREKGYLYLSDADTRPAGAAHPLAAMWDNGADPVAELAHEMDVRRIALARFGEHNVMPGSALGTLAEVLVPVYFHHRYQLEAAAKSIGGLDYAYALRESGDALARPLPAARQRAALDAVVGTLDPAVLDLPESLLVRLVPVAGDYPSRHEFFDSRTSPAFDALGAAATVADMTISMLLAPERLARLVDFHRRDPAMPGPDQVLAALVRRAFEEPAPPTPRRQEIRRSVQATTVRRLILSAAAPEQSQAVRAALESAMSRLATRLAAAARPGESTADLAMRALLARDIKRFLARPATPVAGGPVLPGAPPDPPPGPPIGAIGGWNAGDECQWAPGPVSGSSR